MHQYIQSFFKITVIIDMNDFNHHIPWHNFHAKTDFRFFSFERHLKYSYDHWNIWSIFKNQEVWALHQSHWAGGWLRLFASPAVPGPATLARSAGEKATKAEKNILENSAFSAYRTNHHPRKYRKIYLLYQYILWYKDQKKNTNNEKWSFYIYPC